MIQKTKNWPLFLIMLTIFVTRWNWLIFISIPSKFVLIHLNIIESVKEKHLLRYNQKKAVLQARAAYVLILECLIGEKLREIPRQNGTNENSESRASGETRTKSQIIKEEYGLSPRLARDFQHLTWDGVKAAIGLAFKQKDKKS